MFCRRNCSKISKLRWNGTYWTFPNIHGNVHGLPPHSYYREDPNKSNSKAKPLSNAVLHTAFHRTHRRTLLSHAEFPLSLEKSTLGTKLKPFVDTCTFTLGTDQQPFVDTDQKPSTSSKDTHKEGRMTAIIGMTAMIGIALITTLKTVNMITTRILMSVESQDNFSNKLD